MSDELYHEKLVERAQAGRARGRLEQPDRTATLDNPLCGDRVTIDLKMADGKILEAGHRTRGCLLCEAASALIVERAPGASAASLADLTDAVRNFLQKDGPAPADWGAVEEFAPVRKVKSRQDCVLLPFRALSQALAGG
jgi:NifU-like protein involved in Fe-S cluster formation